MDLVDIDQVLDNLELREAADEHNKATGTRSSTVSAINKEAAISNGGSTSRIATSTPAHSSISSNSSNTNSNSSTSYSKSFVGVSQVFNSLDDYRKNVETLETAPVPQYDDECKLISNIEKAGVNQAAAISKTVQREDAVDHVKQVEHASSSRSISVDNDQRFQNKVLEEGDTCDEYVDGDDVDDGVDDDDDDEELSNDIRQFKEDTGKKRRNYGDNEIDDLTTTTSDSLTTSSSSSFSSGPSPGLLSTTEEHSTPLSDDEVDCAVGNSEDSKINLNPTTQNHASQCANNDNVLVNVQHHEDEQLVTEVTSYKTTGLDDLAVGLSSISINSQSELPREITASSAFGGILNELSVTTTTSLLSQMKDYSESYQQPTELVTETKSSLVTSSLSFPDCDSMKKQEKHLNNDVKVEVQTVPFLDTKRPVNETLPPKFQTPVTFGSTMDEISDTELDSMLQEMDIDDADEPEREITVGSKINNEIDYQVVEQHRSVAVMDAIEGVGATVDHMNADSFSQASTVEFSELKAAQTPAVDINEFGSQSMNSISSSYSSSESSLEDDIQSTGATRKGSSNYRRPKRPTTLDLPALKVNLYANAGQTPPGQNLTHSDAELESCEELANSQGANEVAGGQLPSEIVGEISVDNSCPRRQHADSNVIGSVGSNERVSTNTEGIENEAVDAQDIAEATGYSDPNANLGKVPPIWVPDHMATACMQCQVKFTMIKRRHHCRACGKVLCSVCCSQKFKLEFLANPESRVCVQCFLILMQRQQQSEENSSNIVPADGDGDGAVGGSEVPADVINTVVTRATRSPNPNNPMEYCSTIPPHRQVTNNVGIPPTVIVPVGVLKKEGSNSSNSSNSSNVKTRKRKSVMFSDGIAPGSDLACMENEWSEAKHARRQHQVDKQRSNKPQQTATARTESAVDASTMGLVAQLFRGSIPPIAAAAAISPAHGSLSSTAGDTKPATSKPNPASKSVPAAATRTKRLPPSGCDDNGCFIPSGDNCLPPIYVTKGENSCDFDYKEVSNNFELAERLQRETLKFAVQQNFFVYVKIVNLKCCMNKTVINFTTSGMHQVGNDEIIILLEYEPATNKSDMTEPPIPKDIFVHLNEIYSEADKCNPIAELSFTMPQQTTFLGSREYGGFLYIRATFQCLQDVIMPESPYLIGVLIHRYEVPWAKVFPLRLMLRLGAQYRYYPCPHISIRNRESVYADIAQTIINFLADFRNYSYTLPSIKGMYIHMEDRQTSVLIPRNRYDDVIKAINKSSDHILAFGGNFSKTADGHLVCIQNTKDTSAERYSYSTQAINIQGQPRKVTGASFFVLNEALKSSSGLSGKCSIVEDGLMVQIMPSKMEEVRNALKNTKDIDIVCGPIDADEQQTEIVSIKWVENDRDFGIGVKSPIDSMSLEGVPGMRVHASFNYSNVNYSIRLTEIFMIKCDDWNSRIQAQDITRISEQIARSTSVALLPFLDLLVANGNLKIGLRVTLHQDNVCYEAGTRNTKLPPLYMNALDNNLIPTLHTESGGIEDAIILELIFYILNV